MSYKDVQSIVGCGKPWLDSKIAIANPNSLTQCGDNQVDEIWVSSPATGKGYWNLTATTNYTDFNYPRQKVLDFY